MRTLSLNFVYVLLGVIGSRVIFSSLYKPSEKTAQQFTYIIGALMAIGFYITWAQTGMDPIQLAICKSFGASTASCPRQDEPPHAEAPRQIAISQPASAPKKGNNDTTDVFGRMLTSGSGPKSRFNKLSPLATPSPTAIPPKIEMTAARAATLKEECGKLSVQSCMEIAESLELGQGVPKDIAAAIYFYEKACTAGQLLSCDKAAGLHDQGDGVQLMKNPKRAAEFYKYACTQNDAAGCSSLSKKYVTGDGVPKDRAQALALEEKVCRVAPPESNQCYVTAGLYQFGILKSILADSEGGSQRAAKLHAIACDHKNPWACAALARMHAAGDMPKDPIRIAALFRQACEYKLPLACASLARMYFKGEVGEKKFLSRAVSRPCRPVRRRNP